MSMIGTFIALAVLITILVIGYFVGPLLSILHLFIAGIWYVRVKKHNKEKRRERPSTGPVYFLTGATVLAIYVVVYALDKTLAATTIDGPKGGVSYFFWAIWEPFGVGGWVDGALYDRASMLIHTVLILPMLWLGVTFFRRYLLKKNPAEKSWMWRGIEFVAGLLRLQAFLKGGQEKTAREEEEEKAAGGPKEEKWPPEGEKPSWEIKQEWPYHQIGYDTGGAPDRTWLWPHETSPVFRKWMWTLVFGCLVVVTASNCVGKGNGVGSAFGPLKGLIAGEAQKKLGETLDAVGEELSGGDDAVEGHWWQTFVGSGQELDDPVVLVGRDIRASDPRFVAAMRLAQHKERGLAVYTLAEPDRKIERLLERASKGDVQHAYVRLLEGEKKPFKAGKKRDEFLRSLKAFTQADAYTEADVKALGFSDIADSPFAQMRGTKDTQLEDEWGLGMLSKVKPGAKGEGADWEPPALSPGIIKARVARAGEPVKNFLKDMGDALANAGGGIHYGTSKGLWLASFWFCILLLMALDTTTVPPPEEKPSVEAEEPPVHFGLVELLTAITRANADGDIADPPEIDGRAEKDPPRPHGKLVGVGKNRCVWPGGLDDEREIGDKAEASAAAGEEADRTTAQLSRLVKEFVQQLEPSGDGSTEAQGKLMESQRRALENYAAARQRTSGLIGSIQSTGDNLIEERGARLVTASRSLNPLLIGPEGSGRTTTLALFAADTVLQYCRRVLWICTDERHREQVVNGGGGQRGLEDWFMRSNLRWGIKRGVGLSGPGSVDSNRVEGIRTDIAFLTLEELGNIHLELPGRYDELFTEVGMVVLDDLDRLSGLEEQKAYWVLRRLNSRLEQDADSPVSLFWAASCSQVAEGAVTWAEDLVGQNFDSVDFEKLKGAPQVKRYRFYLNEFIDKRRNPLTVHDLVRWLEALKIPWHLRRCEAHLRDLDLVSAVSGLANTYHVADPRQAAVVILQGNFAEANREATRLAHAGSLSARECMGFFMDVAAQEVSSFQMMDEGDPLRALIQELPRAVASHGNEVLHRRQIDAVHVENWQVQDRIQDLFEKEAVESRQSDYEDHLQTEDFVDFTENHQAFRHRQRVHLALGRWPVVPFMAGTATAESVAVLDRSAGEVLTEVDAAVADIHYYPGRVFLHPNGRYKVREREQLKGDAKQLPRLLVERIEDDQLSSPRKTHKLIDLGDEWDWREDRISIGRFPIAVQEGPVAVETTVEGVNLLEATNLKLMERRQFKESSPKCDYETRAVYIRFEEHMEPKGGAPPVQLLAATGRSLLPLLMRGCEEYVDVHLLGSEAVPEGLALWETVPGGMGYMGRFYDELVLDWLRLIRMRLERSVDVHRLVAVHDHTGKLGGVQADREKAFETHGDSPLGRALAWLDAVLEGESDPGQFMGQVTHGGLPGEGQSGDIGRVWQSDSGRTDQLVWTEHRWELSARLAHLLQYREVILHTAHERQTLQSALLFSDNIEDLVARAQDLGFLMRLEGGGKPSIETNSERYSEEFLPWAINANVAIDLAMERLRPLGHLFARVAQQLTEAVDNNPGLGRYLTAEFILGFVQAMDHDESLKHLRDIKVQKTEKEPTAEEKPPAGGVVLEFSDLKYDEATKQLQHASTGKKIVVHLRDRDKGEQEPRLHTHYCATISKFNNEGKFDRAYIAAKPGADSYRVISTDTGEASELTLPHCGHCERMTAAVEKATMIPQKTVEMDYQEAQIVSPLRALAMRSGNTESKMLLAVALLRLLGIDAMMMKNSLTGRRRLLVACDPSADQGAGYDGYLLKEGFEDEHCIVPVEGSKYFLADVAEPLQPGRVGEPVTLAETEMLDIASGNLIQFFVTKGWKPLTGSSEAPEAFSGVQRQTGRAQDLHGAVAAPLPAILLAEQAAFVHELTGLSPRDAERLVIEAQPWRLDSANTSIEMSDGSASLPVEEKGRPWVQPLLDGLRRAHCRIKSADLDPERAEAIAHVASVYGLEASLIEAWLDGNHAGRPLDQAGGREAWRRHGDYRIEAGDTHYLLRGTASLSAGRFMQAIQRRYGKEQAHG